jgi:hypothetical protein
MDSGGRESGEGVAWCQREMEEEEAGVLEIK